jgi:oligopeptide transport system ATP-binding protein
MTPLMEMKAASKIYKKRSRIVHALKQVNLSMYQGETLGLVGESGSGKSTLGKLLVKLEQVNSGKILYQGRCLSSFQGQEEKAFRKEVQMIFQNPYASLSPRMTAAESLLEALEIHEPERYAEHAKRVGELLDLVGLNTQCGLLYPQQLSGGQRQRVAIARALAVRPSLVICDEPTSALDVSIQAQILNLLKDLQDELNLSYLFISHDLAVVRHMAQKTAVMYHGHIVEIAETETLFNNPLHPYTQLLLDASTGSIPFQVQELSSVGCPFACQCPIATSQCFREPAPLRVKSSLHQVLCFNS